MNVEAKTLNKLGSDKIEPIERETIRRAAWRLIPLLMFSYFCAYLDRSNVAMGATTMINDLGFSSTVFGFGAGLFFLGYCVFEIPSNLILNKVGARRWIGRILLTWGIIAVLSGFVWNASSFYSIRLLLGLAEAGFYPGVVLYLSWWFPSYYRTRMMSIFQSAAVLSMVIGPPIGGLLLHLDGMLGLHGWQWLYILEGLLPVIMCFVVWKLLTDRPADASWLRPEQRTWLEGRLASERVQRESIRAYSLREAFFTPKVLLLTFAYFAQTVSAYGFGFFLPLIVKGLGVSTNWIGAVSALPPLFAFVAMLYWGWHSDRTGERTWHVVAAYLLCGLGLAACVVIGTGHPVITMIALIAAMVGQQSLTPIFWSLPSALLTGVAAAGGIAMISGIGNLGGWLGPSLFGLVKDSTGSDNIALLSLALAPVLGAIALIVVGHDPRLERMSPHS